jgi:hypothetical protein
MPQRTSSDIPDQVIPGSRPPAGADPGEPDDNLLAGLLIRMWTLASGRSLRLDVPPGQLSQEELIDFWADDLDPPTGRHVLADEPDPAGAGFSRRAPRTTDRRSSPARGTRSRQERPVDSAAA